MTETPDAHMVETLRLRTAALHRVSRSNDLLRRECLDREATEQDVRARLADAENALTRARALAEKWQADYDNNWNEYGDGYAEDLRAALDVKP